MKQEVEIININFNSIWKILKREKWLITGITFLLGVTSGIYTFALREEFKSEGKILPEVQGKGSNMGQFAGLAALAGVDLSSAGGSDAVRPDLYPDVLKSTPFFLRLFLEKIKDKNNKELTFQEFYNEEILENKLKKNDQIDKFPKSENYVSFNRQTEENIKDLKERILCAYDKKIGVITISVKMPDPVVAANVTRFSMNYLTDYIISYRTEKQKRDLDFLAERLQVAKGKYFSNQSIKASYTDQMPLNALRLQTADLQRERIEAEYKTSSSFYNSLLQKYEEAKLKMQQETPVIKVLEPPVVPNARSEPSRFKNIVLGFFLGFIVAILVSLIKNGNYKVLILK